MSIESLKLTNLRKEVIRHKHLKQLQGAEETLNRGSVWALIVFTEGTNITATSFTFLPDLL